MAAGQGFKTFVTGEVLTSGDVNGYLMQGINVFATTAARDAAITAPAEGQFAFTKDTNSLWYYDGAAWVASGATGDIEGVTAGVGISGGGTSGTVTVTNSMATAIDAKGDLVPGTGADTFARLAVGANDTVLTADSTAATGLKWATPSAAVASYTLLNSGGTTLTGSATVTVSGISGRSNLQIIITTGSSDTANFDIGLRFNGDTGSNYNRYGIRISGSATPINDTGLTYYTLSRSSNNASSEMSGGAFVTGANSTAIKIIDTVNAFNDGAGTGSRQDITQGFYSGTSAITSVSAFCSNGNFDGGTLFIYGSNN